MGIISGIKDIERATYVLNVLFKHGLGYFLKNYGLTYHLPFVKKIAFHKFKKPDSTEVRLRKAIEELGGTYIKLGQMLSLRPDLVPPEFSREFAKLQDKVPPFSSKKARQIIEGELGKPISKIFRKFSDKPIGSASIGQVHLAVLKNGKKVVVKVQRPGIKEMFRADIDIMYYFAKKLENTKKIGKYSPLEIVQEFERYTKNELNYLTEANNIERFSVNLKGIGYARVPKLYKEYTTDKVITTEFINGRKLSSLLAENKKFNKKKIMTSLINLSLKQVFEQNAFHADLHPGNIIVLGDGKIALLDFGIVGGLTPYLRMEGVKLYVSLVNKDIEGVTKQLLKIGKPSNDADIEDFKRDVDDIVTGWHGTELRQVRVTHMLHMLFNTCIRHRIKMPVDMILLGKALLTVEGTCLMLNPRFNFVKESHQYVSKYISKKAVTKESFQIFLRKSEEMAETLAMIPSETLAVLEKVKQGVIKVDIEDSDLRRLALDIDRSSNRLSYAMIMAALILGGAVLMHANSAPLLKGMSFPALVLYLVAGFMGITLLFSIIKEGSLWR